MKATHRRLQPQPFADQERDRRAELERRIERARQRLLAAQSWPERAMRWKYMRELILRRPGFERVASEPEPVRQILHRLDWEFLWAWETRSRFQ
jgi:peptide subunit release factor 1 (eRF1)